VSLQNDRGLPSVIPDKHGYRLFFQRIVLVPPNRFRPMAKVGESSAEHPQNHHLSKIIAANESLRRIMIETNANSKTILAQTVDAEALQTEAEQAQARQPQSALSKLISVWIDLQNEINMFIDSAKNPNPLGGGDVPGVRQILERKEGLFRRHMMGKRVNYCCRSVISPDPYIGTNEVGIPVLFAKTLHYPVPVNDWNVKYLRKLVENGPNEYPGMLSMSVVSLDVVLFYSAAKLR
jgi:DNA-directed RNA polymerase I subunit RPA1